MTSVLRLRVHGWIPVRVVEDDGIGAGQIYANSARTRRQNEAENTPIVVESVRNITRSELETKLVMSKLV